MPARPTTNEGTDEHSDGEAVEYPPYSVLMSVYRGDDAEHLDEAIASTVSQTVPPAELVVVEDGPLTEPLERCLDRWQADSPNLLVRHRLESNRGLGSALRHGLAACSYELVGRMDADDISVRYRFESQLDYLRRNRDVDVVGGYVAEFEDDHSSPLRVRRVPTAPEGVRRMARFRCPMNHPTVLFRKSVVQAAGSYEAFPTMQDYHLWVRLLAERACLANIPRVLVKMRAGTGLMQRRGGLSYIRDEAAVLNDLRRRGLISRLEFLGNLLARAPVRLAPAKVRTALYDSFLRAGPPREGQESTNRS